jgi:AcrR family transcriptional regulator
MDKIAEKVEYSKGSIYQYFSCKEEVVCVLCEESMGQLVSLFKRHLPLKALRKNV